MALQAISLFPVSPTNGQLYNDGTYTYVYNSFLRTWSKTAQTLSNVGNVVTSNSNVTTGNTIVTSNSLVVGNTTVSNSNIVVGNTTVSTSNITIGNTTVSNGNITVGTATISSNTITVGNSSISQNTISVGNTTLSNSNITVGNTTLSSSNITLGNSTITDNTITAPTITGNLASGNTSIVPVANGNIAISVAGTSNVLVVASTGTVITGNTSVSGNVSSGNISVTGSANIGNVSSYDATLSNAVIISSSPITVIANSAGIFNTHVTDITLGVQSNVTLGSTTGTVTAQNDLNVGDTLDAPNITVGDLYSRRSSVPVTTDTIIDTFPASYFRTAKYTIRAGDGVDYQALEVLLVHNNINSIITVYGSLSTSGTDLIAISSSINGSNVEVKATAVGGSATVNLLGTYVPD